MQTVKCVDVSTKEQGTWRVTVNLELYRSLLRQIYGALPGAHPNAPDLSFDWDMGSLPSMQLPHDRVAIGMTELVRRAQLRPLTGRVFFGTYLGVLVTHELAKIGAIWHLDKTDAGKRLRSLDFLLIDVPCWIITALFFGVCLLLWGAVASLMSIMIPFGFLLAGLLTIWLILPEAMRVLGAFHAVVGLFSSRFGFFQRRSFRRINEVAHMLTVIPGLFTGVVTVAKIR